MKKFIFLSLLLALNACAVVKIDIDGRLEDISVEAVSASGNLRAEHPAWAGTQAYLIFSCTASHEWNRYRCAFMPKKDGEILIARRGLSSGKEINHWTFYRNFKISGGVLRFHSAAPANTKGLEPGIERSSHFHWLRDWVSVKAGIPVILEFESRKGITLPASEFTAEEYRFPLPPGNTKSALRFTVDGGAAMIPVSLENPEKSCRTHQTSLAYNSETEKAEAVTGRVIGKEWTPFLFTFTPGLSGELSLCRRNASNTPGQAEWIEFRNLKVSGAALRHAPRSQVNRSSSGLERTSFPAPLYDILAVEKGKKVTVEFEARTSKTEPVSKYARKMWSLPNPTFKPVWKDKKIQLLGAGDHGVSFVRYGKGFKSIDRPGAAFEVPENDIVSRKEFSVPVELLEEDGIARTTNARFGFPLPEKGFYNVENLSVSGPNGRKVPASISAVGFWPDRSIKWAIIEIPVSLNAKERAVYTVQGGKNVRRMKLHSPPVHLINGHPVVSSGGLHAVVIPGSDALLSNIRYGETNFGNLKVLAGVNGKMQIHKVSVEDSASTIRIDGSLADERLIGGFTARLHFSAGAPVVRVSFTYRADNLSHELNDLDSLHLILTAGNGTLASGAKRIFQGNDLEFYFNSQAKRGFMPETDVFATGKGRVAFALTDAGKRYPKAFAVSEKGLDIQLLPPQPSKNFNADLPGYLRYPYVDGKYRLMAGMNFTEDITFDFSGAAVSPHDIIAVIPCSWYAETNAVRGVFADHYTKPFDDHAATEFYRHLDRKKNQREYGFLNYGDWYGERGGNWGNNEYDFAYGLLTLFARTGNRDIYRLGIAAARHQSDVDIIHATPFKEFLGGNYMHCVGHTGQRYEPNGTPGNWYGGISLQSYANARNGHSWCGGMFTAFMMSGKADIGDSALLLASHLVQDSGKPYLNHGNPRSHGWMLEGLMQAYDATGDACYLKAGGNVADSFFKTQNFAKGGAWPHELPAGYLRGQREGYGSSCFQTGIVLQALHHYSIRAERPEIQKNLHAAAAWLRKAWINEASGWPYVASWDGSALWPPHQSLNMLMLPGVKADGNPAGDEMLCDALGFYILRGVGTQGIGKNLAMDLIFAPAVFESIKNMPEKFELSPAAVMRNRSKSPHLLRLRGPELMELELTLEQSSAKLHFERHFSRKTPIAKKAFHVSVLTENGTVSTEWKGPADRKTDKQTCMLEGKTGDVFRIFIEDDLSSYWEVYCNNEIPIRIKLKKDSLFADGAPLFFHVRVPAGTMHFTVAARAAHSGNFGLVTADSSGKIVGTASGYNDLVNLPWQRNNQKHKTVKVQVSRRDCAQEEIYSFLTWSSGDIALELTGVPEYLEYVK